MRIQAPVKTDEKARAVYLNRVRFLVLAATVVDAGAPRTGAMGLNSFEEKYGPCCRLRRSPA